MGADEWLRRLTELPLAFQPGEGWRYHHSFGVLGILISRVTGRRLGDHLAEDVFGPLGMTDTALWVAEGKLDRLPAAYRHGDEGLAEIEPAGGGNYNVAGNFELHGIKKSITFPATIQVAPDSVAVNAEFAINRRDFGLVYPGKADDLIRDGVVIKLTVKVPRAK